MVGFTITQQQHTLFCSSRL